MISASPMEVAKEMEKLGFKPEGALNDNMDGWTNTLVDALENISCLEGKVFQAMQGLAMTRRNEAKFCRERCSRTEEDIR
jgi:hypothetical protein